MRQCQQRFVNLRFQTAGHHQGPMHATTWKPQPSVKDLHVDLFTWKYTCIGHLGWSFSSAGFWHPGSCDCHPQLKALLQGPWAQYLGRLSVRRHPFCCHPFCLKWMEKPWPLCLFIFSMALIIHSHQWSYETLHLHYLAAESHLVRPFRHHLPLRIPSPTWQNPSLYRLPSGSPFWDQGTFFVFWPCNQSECLASRCYPLGLCNHVIVLQKVINQLRAAAECMVDHDAYSSQGTVSCRCALSLSRLVG